MAWWYNAGMFTRIKRRGAHAYLQVVENRRIDGRVRQRLVASLGRLDDLRAARAGQGHWC